MQASKLIKIADYRYDLPDERIAKYPLEHRDESKLLIYNSGNISHDRFSNIADMLPKDSLMIWNNSRVLNARIIFHKETGAKIEIFCLSPAETNEYSIALNKTKESRWKCIIGNQKKWKADKLSIELNINEQKLTLFAELIEKGRKDNIVEFTWDNQSISFGDILEHSGLTPIPPYLNRESEDLDKYRYQTVYSKPEGSVAAPTAGLHFSAETIKNLEKRNIKHHNITLHVGTGTFQPVKAEIIGDHPMHTEYFYITKENIQAMYDYCGNITAVGTTSVRGIESLYQVGVKAMNGNCSLSENQEITQWESYEDNDEKPAKEVLAWILNEMEKLKISEIKGKTSIMIAPGYNFHLIDRLITNFHQPGSTLLLLISAYIGEDWKLVYDYAMTNDFRFLSYGDSSLLIP
jgi:S-adenosylmethionine:tRNA ribosyltransferase-isomerase